MIGPLTILFLIPHHSRVQPLPVQNEDSRLFASDSAIIQGRMVNSSSITSSGGGGSGGCGGGDSSSYTVATRNDSILSSSKGSIVISMPAPALQHGLTSLPSSSSSSLVMGRCESLFQNNRSATATAATTTTTSPHRMHQWESGNYKENINNKDSNNNINNINNATNFHRFYNSSKDKEEAKEQLEKKKESTDTAEDDDFCSLRNPTRATQMLFQLVNRFQVSDGWEPEGGEDEEDQEVNILYPESEAATSQYDED